MQCTRCLTTAMHVVLFNCQTHIKMNGQTYPVQTLTPEELEEIREACNKSKWFPLVEALLKADNIPTELSELDAVLKAHVPSEAESRYPAKTGIEVVNNTMRKNKVYYRIKTTERGRNSYEGKVQFQRVL